MHNMILGTVIAMTAITSQANSGYAGQETRSIKALSSSDIEGYLSGQGMGHAKAAELNHFPGPRHVLELAVELKLSDIQIDRTQALFNSMKMKASTLGKQLVEKEHELDKLFAQDSISAGGLKSLLSEIGKIQSEIRFVHLHAHLEQKTLLNKHQTVMYDKLRGYSSDHETGHNH